MSLSDRLVMMEIDTAGLRALLSAGIRTAIDVGANRQSEWGQGVKGVGLRYGNAYAEHFIGQVFQQSVAWKLNEDDRYFASGKRGFAPRLGYAVSSAVLARHDDGSRRLCLSGIGGAAAGPFVARAWQPRSTTSAADAAVSFGLTMGIRAGMNVVREFSPRLLRSLR